MTINVVEQRFPRVRRTFTIDRELAEYLDSVDNASHTANFLMYQGLAEQRRISALARLVADLESEAGSADPTQVTAARELFRQ